MRSLTGSDLSEFCLLSEHFAQGYQPVLDQGFDSISKPRQRKAGAGRKRQVQLQRLQYLIVQLTFALTWSTQSTLFRDSLLLSSSIVAGWSSDKKKTTKNRLASIA